jgi:adenylylsulfate kinase
MSRSNHLSKVSRLFADSGCIAITAFISPYKADRELARELHQNSSLPFLEVFVDAPLEVVEARDPKGLYKKARKGEIKGLFASSSASLCLNSVEFTGITAPYEAPDSPEIHVKTDEVEVADAVRMIVEYLTDKEII